jgi:hypothetical protein
MRVTLLLLSGALTTLLISGTATACQCLVQVPARADYWRADAVFMGSVTDIAPSFDDLETSLRTKNRKITVSVETVYRGSVSKEIDLQDWINSCEFRFEKGHKYLIYGYRNLDNKHNVHHDFENIAARLTANERSNNRTLNSKHLLGGEQCLNSQNPCS